MRYEEATVNKVKGYRFDRGDDELVRSLKTRVFHLHHIIAKINALKSM